MKYECRWTTLLTSGLHAHNLSYFTNIIRNKLHVCTKQTNKFYSTWQWNIVKSVTDTVSGLYGCTWRQQVMRNSRTDIVPYTLAQGHSKSYGSHALILFPTHLHMEAASHMELTHGYCSLHTCTSKSYGTHARIVFPTLLHKETANHVELTHGYCFLHTCTWR